MSSQIAEFKKKKALKDFVSFAKGELKREGLRLHIEIDGNQSIDKYSEIADIADLVILNYEKPISQPITDFKSCEERTFREYREICRAENTLIDLSTNAYLGNDVCELSEIEKIIRMRGITPEYSENAKYHYFTLKKYSAGKHKDMLVSYPSAENTKAKLELLGELGFMGANFDIARCPIYQIMMFNSLFNAEKAMYEKKGGCCCEL